MYVMGVSSEYQIKSISANFLLIEIKDQDPLIGSPAARNAMTGGDIFIIIDFCGM